MGRESYLPLWTDSYLADTIHLDVVESGAYLHLLMAAWRSADCSLPDDDKILARWARCNTRQWKRVKAAVMAFWDPVDDGTGYRKFVQKRLLLERNRVDANRKARSQSAKAKHRKNKDSGAANAPAKPLRNACKTSAPIPITIKPSTNNPDGLSDASGDASLGPQLFGPCLDWLAKHTDKRPAKLRPIIGRWRKDHGDAATLQAFMRAQRDPPSDPVAWIAAALRSNHDRPKNHDDQRRRDEEAIFEALRDELVADGADEPG